MTHSICSTEVAPNSDKIMNWGESNEESKEEERGAKFKNDESSPSSANQKPLSEGHSE